MNTENSKKNVLVALSGGVDSSVCITLLQQQGYAVQAAVINFSPAHTSAVRAAQQVADELNIKLHVIDGQALFEREVITPFCAQYVSGFTPNPCIMCNPKVKFKLLFDKADELNIHFVATGHYARIEKNGDTYYIARAASAARDQSYMLYRLPQAYLARLLMPLGEHEKAQVRDMAHSAGLSSANSPDSQEICFIEGGDYAEFIRQKGFETKRGNFIAPSGAVLGAHEGVASYTVGQRRGLKVALGKPVYIKRILPCGDIELAFAEQDVCAGIAVCDIVTMQNGYIPRVGDKFFVKVRSAAKPALCTVSAVEGANSAEGENASDGYTLVGAVCKLTDNGGCKADGACPQGDAAGFGNTNSASCGCARGGKRSLHDSKRSPTDESGAPCAELSIKILFDEPMRVVAPGQSAVFYSKDKVIFGGVISDSF